MIRCKSNIKLVLSNKATIMTKNVIICIGIGEYKQNQINIPGNKKNVLYNVDKLSMFKDTHVIVLGGGHSAID
jgi:thioredoxin reductase (NADPH)